MSRIIESLIFARWMGGSLGSIGEEGTSEFDLRGNNTSLSVCLKTVAVRLLCLSHLGSL